MSSLIIKRITDEITYIIYKLIKIFVEITNLNFNVQETSKSRSIETDQYNKKATNKYEDIQFSR